MNWGNYIDGGARARSFFSATGMQPRSLRFFENKSIMFYRELLRRKGERQNDGSLHLRLESTAGGDDWNNVRRGDRGRELGTLLEG